MFCLVNCGICKLFIFYSLFEEVLVISVRCSVNKKEVIGVYYSNIVIFEFILRK